MSKKRICTACNGTGTVQVPDRIGFAIYVCSTCLGTGKIK